MTTVTIQINERSRLGKAIMELLRSSAKETNAIRLVDTKEEEAYNSKFVEMVLKASAGKNRTTVDPNNLWESIS